MSRSHTKCTSFVDENTGTTYALVVLNEYNTGWRIDVVDKSNESVESYYPPSAFNYIPNQLRQRVKLTLGKHQADILVAKEQSS